MKRIASVLLAVSLVMCILCGCGDTTSATAGASDGTNASSGNTTETVSTESGAAATTPAATEESAANEVTVGIPNDLDSLDPYTMTAAGTREVMLNVYEGLLKPNSAGDYICAVASDYTVSDDGCTYTFTLRDGVKFHNGNVVTTDDILYSFETCAATTVTSSVATALSAITDIHADGNDIVITLSDPNPDFPAYVASTYIIPDGYTDCATAPIGTGPFKFVSRSVQDNAVLEKNTDYYGQQAYLDKVTYKVYEDSTAMVTALNSGALDMVNHLTIDQINTLTNGYNVLSDNMNLVSALYLNNAVAPFDNEQVRQALCWAIDVDAVIDFASGGYGTKVGSSMYPNFTKYYEQDLADTYGYDTAKAKELLTEAGYGDGFSFSITVPSNYEHPYGDMAEVIIENLADVGITATIEYVDWSTWLDRVYSGRDFETTIVGFDASTLTASAMLQRWTSDAHNNMISYSNPEYDETFAQAQACTDDAEATALYKQCLTILADTAANVYIQDLGEFVVINPALDGYEFYPLYMVDMSTIHYVNQ